MLGLKDYRQPSLDTLEGSLRRVIDMGADMAFHDADVTPTELEVAPSQIGVGPESTEFSLTVKRR